VLSQKKKREFYHYFPKIMVKSAFFANGFYHYFPKIMVKSKTKKGRFYHYFQQKTPILPLFSIFLETNGKIGLFLNTLNAKLVNAFQKQACFYHYSFRV